MKPEDAGESLRTYRCSECGDVATQGVDEQGGEGALHCAAHPSAVIDSVVSKRSSKSTYSMLDYDTAKVVGQGDAELARESASSTPTGCVLPWVDDHHEHRPPAKATTCFCGAPLKQHAALCAYHYGKETAAELAFARYRGED